MKRKMFTAFCLSGLILFVAAISVSAQYDFRLVSANEAQKSERQAEKIVVRAVEKFGQTLDFAGIYQETFVKDKDLRRREDKPLLAGFIGRQILEQMDTATLEQAYITSQNLYWMFAVYSLQKNSDDIARIERGIRPSLSQKQRVIYERIMSERTGSIVESQTEIADCLAVYEKMTSALRREIKSSLRQRLRRGITARASRFAPTGSEENAFKISVQLDGDPFPFSFVAVEKSGVIKILSVDIDD